MADEPQAQGAYSLVLSSRIEEIPAAEWNACAADPDNPFISHEFLAALEAGGAVGGESGWTPMHLTLRDGAGQIVAAAPLYVKDHSFGEYVFDHAWADAFHRAGGRYYPKLQLAIPFSPVPGRRLLIRPEAGVDVARIGRLLAGICAESGLSSVHVTFCTEAEAEALAAAGFLHRRGVQFHWHNAGYRDFEDFLAALASRKRKMIRRERREAAALGLDIRIRRGAEITEPVWDGFYRAYLATTGRKWGGPYLTRAFFSELPARLGERVVLITAERGGSLVAGALNLVGERTLYGRNWATREELPFLHFELCYYRAIEFAIAEGLASVQAGAQGEHKLARGYVPVFTHSAHWFAHRGLARAVEAFIRRESEVVAVEAEELGAFAPFRRDGALDEEHGQ